MEFCYELPVSEGIRLVVEQVSSDQFDVSIVQNDGDVKMLKTFKSLSESVSYCDFSQPWFKMVHD
jgi:hypothetical protein